MSFRTNRRTGGVFRTERDRFPSERFTKQEAYALKGKDFLAAEKIIQGHGYTFFKIMDNPMTPLRGLGYIDNKGNTIYIYWNEGFGIVHTVIGNFVDV